MDEAIADLVLAPFRDLVAQGRVASGNAEEANLNGMHTAAQSLVKEGERALRRLEPLCQKKYEDFGAAFVNALKDDEEISKFIEHLNDLLYDFEEFVEAENFNAQRFLELQACSRRAGPGISHRITRLKLLPQAEEGQGTETSPASPFGPAVLVRQPSDDVSLQHGQPLPYPEDMEAGYVMPWPPRQEFEARQAEFPVLQALPTVQEEELSTPPSRSLLDPWSQRSHDIEHGLELIGQRREHTTYSDSAIGSEANSEHASSPNITGHQPTKDKPPSPPPPPQPAVPPRSPNRIVTPSAGAALGPSPEQTASVFFRAAHHGRNCLSPISPRLNENYYYVATSSTNASSSIRSAVSDQRRSRDQDSYFDAVSPVSPTLRALEYPVDSQFRDLSQVQAPSRTRSPYVRPLFSQESSSESTAHETETMEPVVLPAPGMIPDGLILVEEDADQPVWSLADVELQLGGCAISLNSSYYQFRGFCAGAVEVIQGGLGIKHIKKQGLAVGNIEVAKCKSCAYELEWKAVERDLNNEDTENLTSAGVGFRLRFLSKSHIQSKNIGEQIYGCLLCVQLRQTTHPNDATVFLGQRQLFAHLARHPRPLPRVPGLTVIESREIPRQLANNYDIHLAETPRSSYISHIIRDLAALPTATTLQTCQTSQAATARRPVDGGEVLSFAAGARILGVEYPEKYQGAWCVGWADHEYGLIPAEAIRLDSPKKNDIFRKQGSSSMKAVARWRFAVKEGREAKGAEWLPLSKGEVLTDVGWSHQDHWCWSGTNAKGRSGLFPRSHIEPGTLMEVATKSDCASVTSSERRTGLLSRISIRHRIGSGGGGGSKASIH